MVWPRWTVRGSSRGSSRGSPRGSSRPATSASPSRSKRPAAPHAADRSGCPRCCPSAGRPVAAHRLAVAGPTHLDFHNRDALWAAYRVHIGPGRRPAADEGRYSFAQLSWAVPRRDRRRGHPRPALGANAGLRAVHAGAGVVALQFPNTIVTPTYQGNSTTPRQPCPHFQPPRGIRCIRLSRTPPIGFYWFPLGLRPRGR